MVSVSRKRRVQEMAADDQAGPRKQFSKLGADMRTCVEKILLENEHSEARTGKLGKRPFPSNLTAPTVRGPHFSSLDPFRAPDVPVGRFDSIGVEHLRYLINGKGESIESVPVIGRISEIYILHVCHHINRIHNRHLPGTIPLCIAQDARFSMYFQMYEHCSRRGRAEGRRVVRAGYVRAAERLRREGITAAVFKQLLYFFLPIVDNEHNQLLIISPVTKTIRLFDSGHKPVGNRIMRLAQACLLIDDITALSSPKDKPWFRPSEWKVHSSLGATQSKTDANCVLHCLTNAQSIAFGYKVESGGGDRSFADRRWRVAAELINGGFEPHDGDVNAEFWYLVDGKIIVPDSSECSAYRADAGFGDLIDEKMVGIALKKRGAPHIWA